MKTKIISVTFLFLMMAVLGQTRAQEASNDQATTGFAIHSVNLTVGYYSPEMDYWNDTYLPSKGISETFGGNPTIGANVTFSLPASLRARVGASIWSGKVEGDQGASVNSLKIGLTRFNLGLMYAPQSIVVEGFQPYLGIEGQANLIKNEYDINNDNITQNGQDISFAPLLGVDRAFGHFNLGLEVKYNVGNYIQEEAAATPIEHEVSINGAEVSLSIGYKF